MTHPLSTANLLALAATASTEPDLHHVDAAYHAAQALALLGEEDGQVPEDFDYDLAANVAALRMALASAAVLARKLYDHDHPALPDFLYRIAGHYVRSFEALMADIEHNADLAALLTP